MKTKILSLFIGFGLLFSACTDWLQVSSQTDFTEDDMYSSEEGFHKALTGIYIKMADQSLYGAHLTWRMVEYFGHSYHQQSGSNEYQMHFHNYTNSAVSGPIENAWNGLYRLIAQCNNILGNLEAQKATMNECNYQLMKGETMALRSYFYLDLLRLFGYGNLRNRPEVMNKLTIPYVTEFTKDITVQKTYKETIKQLKTDLQTAIDLLWGEDGENCQWAAEDQDRLNAASGTTYYFWQWNSYDDKPRMDYFSARATMARLLMWEGTDEGYEEAAKIAEEWILAGEDDVYDTWDWVAKSTMTAANELNRDYTFSREHVWFLGVQNLYEVVGDWLDCSSPNSTYHRVFLNTTMANDIFEYETGNNTALSDVRYVYNLTPMGSGGANYRINKLENFEGEAKFKDMIPMINSAEMFYIAAEVYLQQGNKKLALERLNKVRQQRGITTDLPETLTDAEVKAEIMKEYRKSFLCEGQLFYLYKRWGEKMVAGYAQEMSDKQYVLPYPDSEIINGGRVQE